MGHPNERVNLEVGSPASGVTGSSCGPCFWHGVAEILRSQIPLLGDLGLVAGWKLISGDREFFAVTKVIHNALHGTTGL